MRVILGIGTFVFAIFGFSGPAPAALSKARAAAIHECSVKAATYSSITVQSTQIIVYDTCMAEHGQIP